LGVRLAFDFGLVRWGEIGSQFGCDNWGSIGLRFRLV